MMRRIACFALLALFAGRPAMGQSVPGRDLLSFPLGLNAESPAFGTIAGLGFWNPASVVVPDDARLRLAVATMSAPADLAISAQLATVGWRWRHGLTIGASVASASVTDLLRTDSDPQSLGDEIPYSTFVYSLLIARRVGPVTAGMALRARDGRLDDVRRHAVSLDGGIITRGFTTRDVRFAASTFLASPFGSRREAASVLAGFDGRLAGRDTARTVRAGISAMATDGQAREAFAHVAARYGRIDGRVGAARVTIHGRVNWHPRLGLAFHHRGYVIAVAREESANNLSSTYQFSLSSVLR
jgi:hypothetical protein